MCYYSTVDVEQVSIEPITDKNNYFNYKKKELKRKNIKLSSY